jgi:hypothetical protein
LPVYQIGEDQKLKCYRGRIFRPYRLANDLTNISSLSRPHYQGSYQNTAWRNLRVLSRAKVL